MKLTPLIAVLLGMLLGSAQATTVLYQDFNELVDTSQHSVMGTVAKLNAAKASDGEIYTTVVLRNASVITAAGEKHVGKPVQLRFKGGTVEQLDKAKNVIGEETLLTHGAPEFEVGDQVVVFVSHNGVADMPFVGFSQGVFKVNDRQQVQTANRELVVGFQGADLITETDHGLMARGQLLDNAERTEHRSSEGVMLLESDAGEDRLVNRSVARVERETLEKSTGKAGKASYAPVDVRNFVSMIQERKAQTATLKANAQVDMSVDDLVRLPDVVRGKSAPADAPMGATRKQDEQRTEAISQETQLPLERPDASTQSDDE